MISLKNMLHCQTMLCILLVTYSQAQLDGKFWWLNIPKSTTVASSTTTFTTTAATPVTTTTQPAPTTTQPAPTTAQPAPTTAQPAPTTRETTIDALSPKINNGGFDSFTEEEEICCECVPFYLCINGTISTTGEGLLDIRAGESNQSKKESVNVHFCPDPFHVCCKVPNASSSCSERKPLPPETHCSCIAWELCLPELVVSDGFGNTSIFLPGFGLASHSRCHHPLEVCCAFETSVASTSTTSYEDCECVEKWQCGIDGHIISDGAGILDLRDGSDMEVVERPLCKEDPQLVCCLLPKEELISTSGQTQNLSVTTTTTYTTRKPSTTTYITTQPNTSTGVPEQLVRQCGIRNSYGVNVRIVGFKNGQSQFGEFPWVAAILRIERVRNKFIHLFVGGGTLIHPYVIITAAHKVAHLNPKDIIVRLGEWDTKSTVEQLPHQDITVAKVVIHPGYHPRTLFNDFALLFLQEPAKIGRHIHPICIVNNLTEIDFTRCIINGWGKDQFENGRNQVIMKSLELPAVDHHTCQSILRKTRLGSYFRLHRTFMCAGGEKGKDACKGDGGGPLACPLKRNPKRYQLVGITAWGIGCGDDGVPGVYANTYAVKNWIKDTVEMHHISTIPLPTVGPTYLETVGVEHG